MAKKHITENNNNNLPISNVCNLLRPFHYRIHNSVEWSVLISLYPLPVRHYCVAEFVAAAPNAFAAVNDEDADDCDDDGADDGFAVAE